MHRNSQSNDEKCYKPQEISLLVKYESARSRFKTPNERVYRRLQEEKSKGRDIRITRIRNTRVRSGRS